MSERTVCVGIDVSKGTLDIAVTAGDNKVVASMKVNNTKAGYRKVAQWANKQCEKNGCSEIHYCMESTGIYSEGIAEYLQEEENSKVSIINPLQAKSFAKSRLLRTKTDKVDAEILALYAATLKPDATGKMPKELKELRSLIRHLDYLIRRRAEEKGHLEAAINSTVTASIKKTITHYDKQIRALEREIEDHLKKHPGLKKKVKLLETIPGIGHHTARILLCEMHSGGGTDNLSAKAQTAHAGLAPRHRQSGTITGRPCICRTGNPRLRKCLFYPALVASKHNPIIREFHNRLMDNGKHRMVAVAASMRKLLVIAIGVLNNDAPFDPEWISQKQF